jgi:DtxR family Mn-dependent transcriptional regulator
MELTMTSVLTQQLSPSLEDYLEAAFWATATHGAARARDIAKAMQVRASSVTGALQALARNQYINYTPYEAITLTAEGFDAALEVVRKHKILKDFFTGILGLDEARSEDIACKIEHSIPFDVVNRIARLTISDVVARSSRKTHLDPARYETTIADLKPAKPAVIIQVKPRASVSRQLAHMGLGRGALITVERIAPLGDPISVKIRGCRMMLRKKDAANIVVVSK